MDIGEHARAAAAQNDCVRHLLRAMRQHEERASPAREPLLRPDAASVSSTIDIAPHASRSALLYSSILLE